MTVTGTVPAIATGVRTAIDVAVWLTRVPATPPNRTDTPVPKPVPAMVTVVLPVVGPLVGVRLVIVGFVGAGVTKVKAAARVTAPPSGLATVTDTAPAATAGVRTVIDVAVWAVTVPACVPKSTAAPLRKSSPEMVTDVPPVVGPLDGARLVMMGSDTGPDTARYVNAAGSRRHTPIGVGHRHRRGTGHPGRHDHRQVGVVDCRDGGGDAAHRHGGPGIEVGPADGDRGAADRRATGGRQAVDGGLRRR